MRLELPPERRLPNPEWMVERILTERSATAGAPPAARTWWLSGLVAAAVLITAAVIGWAALVPTGRPQVGAAPETAAATAGPSRVGSPTAGTSEISPAPTSAATGPEKPATVPPTTLVPVPTRAASSTMTGGDVYAILVETCVRSLPPNASSELPLSRTSWTLSTSAGTVTTDAPITDPITLPSAYPGEGRYGIGDCAT